MRFGPPEPRHHRCLLVDHHDFPAIDHTHPIGHFLGLLDIVRGEDDGDAARTHLVDDRPHALAQLDIDPRGRLVEKQQVGLVRQRLCDQHAPLHPARQRHDALVTLVPQAQALEDLLDPRWIGREAEQPARIGDRAPHRLEHVGAEFLRYETDPPPRLAPVGRKVVAKGTDRARCRAHQTANRPDQSGLARAIGPEQRENLALADRQVDVVECLEAAGIDLGQPFDLENCVHRMEASCRAPSGEAESRQKP